MRDSEMIVIIIVYVAVIDETYSLTSKEGVNQATAFLLSALT